MCTASVDSVMEIETCALSKHSKRHLLYSAATAQSTIDYSRKAVEDLNVVDSPPNRTVIPVPINLPSPLRGKRMGESSKSKCQDTNGAQCSLNLELSQSPNNILHKEDLHYLLHRFVNYFFIFCISKSEATLHKLMFLLHIAAYAHPTEVNTVCTLA